MHFYSAKLETRARVTEKEHLEKAKADLTSWPDRLVRHSKPLAMSSLFLLTSLLLQTPTFTHSKGQADPKSQAG